MKFYQNLTNNGRLDRGNFREYIIYLFSIQLGSLARETSGKIAEKLTESLPQ